MGTDRGVQAAGDHGIQHAAAHGLIELIVGISVDADASQVEGLDQIALQGLPAHGVGRRTGIQHANAQFLGQGGTGQQEQNRQQPSMQRAQRPHQSCSGR